MTHFKWYWGFGGILLHLDTRCLNAEETICTPMSPSPWWRPWLALRWMSCIWMDTRYLISPFGSRDRATQAGVSSLSAGVFYMYWFVKTPLVVLLVLWHNHPCNPIREKRRRLVFFLKWIVHFNLQLCNDLLKVNVKMFLTTSDICRLKPQNWTQILRTLMELVKI